VTPAAQNVESLQAASVIPMQVEGRTNREGDLSSRRHQLYLNQRRRNCRHTRTRKRQRMGRNICTVGKLKLIIYQEPASPPTKCRETYTDPPKPRRLFRTDEQDEQRYLSHLPDEPSLVVPAVEQANDIGYRYFPMRIFPRNKCRSQNRRVYTLFTSLRMTLR
jgi:hypothetical protein